VRIEFTYRRAADHFGHPANPRPEASSVPAFVFGVMAALLGATIMVLVRDEPRPGVAGAAIFLFGVAVIVGARQQSRRPYAVAPAARTERRWVLTDQAIEVSTELTEARSVWAAFAGASVLPKSYLLVMKDRNDRRTFDIPREPLTPEDDQALRAVFQENGILPYARGQ
jgi:hypothetical protein